MDKTKTKSIIANLDNPILCELSLAWLPYFFKKILYLFIFLLFNIKKDKE